MALSGGCAHLEAAAPAAAPATVGAAGAITPADSDDDACRRFVARVDAAIDAAGVRDAESTRIDGFPTLRADRLLASYAAHALADPARFPIDDWLGHLRSQDRAARRAEIGNLPIEYLDALGSFADLGGAAARRTATVATLERCAQTSVARLRDSPEALAALGARTRVPDDYSDSLRALGLYPVTRLAFHRGIVELERSTTQAFTTQREQIARGTRQYSIGRAQADTPEHDARRTTRTADAGIATDAPDLPRDTAGLPRDALGLVRLTPGQHEALLRAHAPVIAVAGAGDDNRIGALRLDPITGRASVDTATPTVYARIAHTRYGSSALLQLVYTAWFPRRPPSQAFDPLAGLLDGVIVRLTFAPDGRLALIDSIHPCGCYHLFVPVGATRPRPPPEPIEEWAFVPLALPDPPSGYRVRVRVSADTHYVSGVDFVQVPEELAQAPSDLQTAYGLAHEHDLRSLPTRDDGRRSLYGPDGLVAGTERAERWVFWPMGIESAGAMRQWGRHATAFVGRRHFDDHDLVERRFVLP